MAEGERNGERKPRLAEEIPVDAYAPEETSLVSSTTGYKTLLSRPEKQIISARILTSPDPPCYARQR